MKLLGAGLPPAGLAPRKVRRLALLAASLSAAALPATAQPKAAPTYEVRVLGIRGTNRNREIAPRLRPIAALLRKLPYTGFKLERSGRARLAEGRSSTTELLAGYRVRVTPLRRRQQRVTLRIAGLRRVGGKDVPKWSTTLTIDRGRYCLQLQKLPGGDGLIIAVTAR